MAAGTLPVQSDPTLLEDIRRYGKFDTEGCYQCGTCTLSCELATDFANFPRRSIRYALLGLRAPLQGKPRALDLPRLRRLLHRLSPPRRSPGFPCKPCGASCAPSMSGRA